MVDILNGVVGRAAQQSAALMENSCDIESVRIHIRLIGVLIALERPMNHVLAIRIARVAVN